MHLIQFPHTVWIESTACGCGWKQKTAQAYPTPAFPGLGLGCNTHTHVDRAAVNKVCALFTHCTAETANHGLFFCACPLPIEMSS